MALDAADIAARVAGAVTDSGARPAEVVAGVAIEVEPAAIAHVLAFLRDEPGLEFDLFLDITAADYEPLRGTIEVVYVLRSLADPSRLLVVKTQVPADAPILPTASDVYLGADWAEREVFDMFGVRFEGHPNLKRILMYEEFEGYPLRKSYPYQKRQPLVPERDPIANPWPKRS